MKLTNEEIENILDAIDFACDNYELDRMGKKWEDRTTRSYYKKQVSKLRKIHKKLSSEINK